MKLKMDCAITSPSFLDRLAGYHLSLSDLDHFKNMYSQLGLNLSENMERRVYIS